MPALGLTKICSLVGAAGLHAAVNSAMSDSVHSCKSTVIPARLGEVTFIKKSFLAMVLIFMLS